MKFQVSMDDALFERVTSFASENGLSRSAFISVAVSEYMRANDLKSVLTDHLNSFLASSQDFLQGKISADEYHSRSEEGRQIFHQLRLQGFDDSKDS